MRIIQTAIRSYRPPPGVRPTEDPRVWWHYALFGVMAVRNPVILGFPRSYGPTRLNVFAVCKLIRKLNRYVDLHKRYLSNRVSAREYTDGKDINGSISGSGTTTSMQAEACSNEQNGCLLTWRKHQDMREMMSLSSVSQ